MNLNMLGKITEENCQRTQQIFNRKKNGWTWGKF